MTSKIEMFLFKFLIANIIVGSLTTIYNIFVGMGSLRNIYLSFGESVFLFSLIFLLLPVLWNPITKYLKIPKIKYNEFFGITMLSIISGIVFSGLIYLNITGNVSQLLFLGVLKAIFTFIAVLIPFKIMK